MIRGTERRLKKKIHISYIFFFNYMFQIFYEMSFFLYAEIITSKIYEFCLKKKNICGDINITTKIWLKD